MSLIDIEFNDIKIEAFLKELSPAELAKVNSINNKRNELIDEIIKCCPKNGDRNIAIIKANNALMWAVFSMALNKKED